MPTEIILPRVDMDMATGRIARWHVAEGDRVEKGRVLFEIETDKAAMEIDAPADGIVREIRAAADEDIPVGTIVAWLYDEGEAPIAHEVADVAAPPAPDAAPAPIDRPGATSVPAETPINCAGPRATPLARRLAAQHGLDLSAIAGSGPRGRVQSEDVLAALADAPGAASDPVPDPSIGTAPHTAPRGALHRAWLRTGENGHTPALLIHGFGAEIGVWRPFLAGVDAGTPVLAVDLPGHGGSSGVAADSLETIAGLVEDVLAQEGVTGLHLVGHSLGSAVATLVAARARADIRSLLLLAPAGLGPDINGAFLDGFLRARSEAALKPWLRLLKMREDDLSPGLAAAIMRQRLDGRLAAAQSALAAALMPDGTQAFTTRGLLDGLAMPVKVVVGLDDRIIPADHARGLPGTVAVHAFAATGHMPHLERREAVTRLWQELMRAAG